MKIRFKIEGAEEFVVSNDEIQIIDEENNNVVIGRIFRPRKKNYSENSLKIEECWRCFNSKENCTCNELKIFKNIEAVEKFMEEKESKKLQKDVLKEL